jgi:platelet-activating factor acetylhydrolase
LFAQLNAGEAPIVNLKPDSPREALPGFKGRLKLSAVTVAGHSYGATGAMQALKSAGTKDILINAGIALDPGKGSGPLNNDIDVPVLVMQSGEWTEKQVDFYGQGKHFDVVRKIVDNIKEGWFMTLSNCVTYEALVPILTKSSWLRSSLLYRRALDRSLDHEDGHWYYPRL